MGGVGEEERGRKRKRHPGNTASGSVVQDLSVNAIFKNIDEYNNCTLHTNLSRIAMLAEISNYSQIIKDFEISPLLRQVADSVEMTY